MLCDIKDVIVWFPFQAKPRAVDVSIDKESSLVKTEKKGLIILEDAMERNRKNPRYIYFISMVIGFILLLALIGNIISVLLPIKTWTRW